MRSCHGPPALPQLQFTGFTVPMLRNGMWLSTVRTGNLHDLQSALVLSIA